MKKFLFIFYLLTNFKNVYVIVILPYNKHSSVLNYVKKYLPKNPIILEAGAFDGTDTLIMNKFWPNSKIHSFEPLPEIFQLLAKKTKNYKNIYIYNYALSQMNGFINFYVSKKPDGSLFASSSILPPNMPHGSINYTDQIKVPTITLDDWAKKFNIQSIDFLWLDMQGYELPALKSGTNILKKVKVIYIEVEFVPLYKDQPLYIDVKNWLEQNNFYLAAKDFEDTKKYEFGNCIFINKN